MNAEVDETVPPEEVMAIHNAGFRAVHAERIAKLRVTFAKQRSDDDRVRVCKAPHVANGMDVPRKFKDGHLLEKVLHEREDRMREEPEEGMSARQLPPEQRAYLSRPTRIHYLGPGGGFLALSRQLGLNDRH
jgi:hypothetical protein